MRGAGSRGDQLLDKAREGRGYTLPLHRTLARHDPDVLADYEAMMGRLYLAQRRLAGQTKELVYVAVLITLGGSEEHIRAHMEKAVREGASPEDVLETIELLIAAAGVARASIGLEIWSRVFSPAEEGTGQP